LELFSKQLEETEKERQNKRRAAAATKKNNKKKRSGDDGGDDDSDTTPSRFHDDKHWDRFYVILCRDEIRPLYFDFHNCLDRIRLDGRKSPMAPHGLWDAVSKLYNDNDFEAKTDAFPDLHSNYATCKTIRKAECPTVDADKCKTKYSTARCRLAQMVANYEQSGSGDGMQGPDGTLVPHQKSSFLNGERPHFLHFWALLEKHDMLKTACSALPDDVAVKGDRFPSATKTYKSRQKQRDHDLREMSKQHAVFNGTFEKLADNEEKKQRNLACQTMLQVQRRLLQVRRELIAEPDCPLLQSIMEDVQNEYNEVKRELRNQEAASVRAKTSATTPRALGESFDLTASTVPTSPTRTTPAANLVAGGTENDPLNLSGVDDENESPQPNTEAV
jgi:hypothetical protein